MVTCFLSSGLHTLMGHKANISSLSFHPFTNFLASASMDTNIKVCVKPATICVILSFFLLKQSVSFCQLWDIRRRGCVFKYKVRTV